MLHIPLLRQGRPYRSLDVMRVPHYRTHEPFVEISEANVGMIRRDLIGLDAAREKLASRSIEELLRICADGAELFLRGDLPLGDGVQAPEDYVEQVSATTGLPHVLARNNMFKIHKVMAEMRAVLKGLTRSLDVAVVDRGFGPMDGQESSFFPRGNSLGVVSPSNSPGVHSLWIPALALKVPLVLKPGGAEPWTPYRIIQALLRAGALQRLSAITRPITRGAARFFVAVSAAWSSATWARQNSGNTILVSKCMAPVTARSSSAATRSRAGRNTWT